MSIIFLVAKFRWLSLRMLISSRFRSFLYDESSFLNTCSVLMMLGANVSKRKYRFSSFERLLRPSSSHDLPWPKLCTRIGLGLFVCALCRRFPNIFEGGEAPAQYKDAKSLLVRIDEVRELFAAPIMSKA